MVDMKHVSVNVQQQVKNIMQQEGNKKKIDSEAEYQALQMLAQELSSSGASRHEQEYIQGFMIDYQNTKTQAAEKEQKNQVSDAARETVKNIKKMFPDKNEFSEAEARALLAEIQNTRGDYSKADIEYMKQELIKAGFGNLLCEGSSAPVKTTKKEEPVKEEKSPAKPVHETGEDEKNPVNDEKSKTQTIEDNKTQTKNKKDISPKSDVGETHVTKPHETKKSKNVSKPAQPNTENLDNSSSVKPKGVRIPDTAKEHGQRIARDLQKAILSISGIITGANNSRIAQLINEVDKNTAYNFLVAYIYADGDNKLDVNRDIYGVSDKFNKITAQQAKHLVDATLQQAREMGLEKTDAYQNLNNLLNGMNATLHGNSDADKVLQKQLDQALTKMVNEMTNVVQ